MHFEHHAPRGQSVIRIVHKGQTQEWSASPFKPDSFPTVFAYTNPYFESLSEQTKDLLFYEYSHIKTVLADPSYDAKDLTLVLMPLVASLLRHIDMRDAEVWLRRRGIVIPRTVKPDFINNELVPYTQTGTYTESEFIQLATLSMILRMMLPIWGVYIERIKDVVENERDYNALGLTSRSQLIEYPGYVRLHDYVTMHIGKLFEKPMTAPSVTFRMTNTDKYIALIFGVIMVRRVCFGDMTGSNPNANLITFIYIFMGGPQRTGRALPLVNDDTRARKTGGRDRAGLDDTQGSSVLELTVTRQDITVGQIVGANVYASDPHRMLEIMPGDFDRDVFWWFYEQTQTTFDKGIIRECQHALIKYVMHPWLQYQLMNVIKPDAGRVCMAIAQAWFWCNGYREFAAMVGCITDEIPEEANRYISIGPAKLDGVYAQKIMDELRLTRTAKRQRARASVDKSQPVHQCFDAINELVKQMSLFDWYMVLPSSHWCEVFADQTTPQLFVPKNVRNMLAQLFVDLKNRRIKYATK